MRERPGGYSTTAPRAAKATANRLHRLNCGDWSGDVGAALSRLGVQTIALHRGLYVGNQAVPSREWFVWRSLLAHGWTVQRTAGPVWLFEQRSSDLQPALREPARSQPVFCQGWYGDVGGGRFMSETHAPFWIYGTGRLRLDFAPSTLRPRISVDNRNTVELRGRGWHLVTVDVPKLVEVEGQERLVGLRLVRAVTSPSSGSPSRRTGSSP